MKTEKSTFVNLISIKNVLSISIYKTSLLIFFALTITSCSVFSQKTTADKKNKSDLIIGICMREAFLKKPHKNWFNEEYKTYVTDKTVIEDLKQSEELTRTEIVVVFGTWCSDSRRELPRFFRIVDEVGEGNFNLKLIGVDKNKSVGDNSLEEIDFSRIPTFIFFKNGKESGRIIESTKISLEADILEILSN